MVIQKEVEGTSFDSAFQTGNASLMTLDQYIGNVKSGEYASRIAYLRGLIKAGKKDEAVKMLEEGQNLVEDKDVVDEMILDARNSRDTGEYILPESSSRYLTDADISGLTLQQINYAKNEIYARHGRKFQSAELQNYFNSKSWYSGTIEAADFDESVLNDFEKKNAELLSSKEFSMESGGYKLDQ